VSAGGYYNANASVPVTATANLGYYFAGWTGPVASASNAGTTVSMSGPQTVTANFARLAAVTYLGDDTTTEGAWTVGYGTDGYVIDNLGTTPPSYGTVSLTGDAKYTWAGISSDPRALETAANSSVGTAATFYSAGSFNINVNLTDGKAHRVALYLLDWDSTARTETVSVLDAPSGTVLNSQTFSSFHNGVYVSWSVQGNVIFRVTKMGGVNAVVSGIFFDPLPGAATATYAGIDKATLGGWTGFYGTDGQIIANDRAAIAPSYAEVSVTGDKLWTWANPTTDLRGLQTGSGSATLLATTYYSTNSFIININLTDGGTHRVSLYLVDWDSYSRVETISILDADTGAVLDTQTYASFFGGQYVAWYIKGRVAIQVTKTAGANAVVSGIFFDPPTALPSATGGPVSYVGFDSATQGSWTGHYGETGELIATEAANLPGFAVINVLGDKLYTWAASTTDVRALQTASGASTRAATTFYSGSANGSFDIDVNLTDGNSHKISLYLLDWDSTVRTETITISDASTGKPLDAESYAGFHNGGYAVWNITGHVIIQVIKTGGANAVVSGIFVD
jgi:hypothetical protein